MPELKYFSAHSLPHPLLQGCVCCQQVIRHLDYKLDQFLIEDGIARLQGNGVELDAQPRAFIDQLCRVIIACFDLC